MHTYVFLITLCLLLPNHDCSERSPEVELQADDLYNSDPSHTDIRSKLFRVQRFVYAESDAAASHHGSQQQHQSNDVKSKYSVNKGM
jgi:hypothetical protein